jgi:hypothetical protein
MNTEDKNKDCGPGATVDARFPGGPSSPMKAAAIVTVFCTVALCLTGLAAIANIVALGAKEQGR